MTEKFEILSLRFKFMLYAGNFEQQLPTEIKIKKFNLHEATVTTSYQLYWPIH